VVLKLLELTLITGRTRQQGLGLEEGRFEQAYREEVCRVELSPQDLARLGVDEGDAVLLQTEHGSMSGTAWKNDGLPEGLVFVPFGPPVNSLVGGDTHGVGMPEFKGITVKVTRQ